MRQWDNLYFMGQIKKPSAWEGLIIGAPETIRTSDRLVRSQVLYPAELRARKNIIFS
jgi:hypothetical protein